MVMLEQHLEAIIFASEHPVTIKEMQECLVNTYGWQISREDIERGVDVLCSRYKEEQFSFELVCSGGGWRFMTKKDYYPTVSAFLCQKSRKRLSTAALETLAVIAYKQPVTKAEIEHIRGVNCDHALQKLLEKELIVIAGRSDGPGRPLLYKTSQYFMDYFGINSPRDLPKLKEIDLSDDQNVIGVPSDDSYADSPEPVSSEIQASET